MSATTAANGTWTTDKRGAWSVRAPLDILTDEDGEWLTDEDGNVLEGGEATVNPRRAAWAGGRRGTWR